MYLSPRDALRLGMVALAGLPLQGERRRPLPPTVPYIPRLA